MTDITIPDEALQRAWETYLQENCGPHAFKAACIAMLKAWPNVGAIRHKDGRVLDLILPLTENSNDKG